MWQKIGRVVGLLVAALVIGLAGSQFAGAEGSSGRWCFQTHVKGKWLVFANVCSPTESFILRWKDLSDFMPEPLPEPLAEPVMP